jgi:hypothetical protein
MSALQSIVGDAPRLHKWSIRSPNLFDRGSWLQYEGGTRAPRNKSVPHFSRKAFVSESIARNFLAAPTWFCRAIALYYSCTVAFGIATIVGKATSVPKQGESFGTRNWIEMLLETKWRKPHFETLDGRCSRFGVAGSKTIALPQLRILRDAAAA